MKTVIARFLVSSLALLSFVSQANLLVNGSFDDTDVSKTVTITSANNVDGWEGTYIELWDDYKNYDAYDGDLLLELNSNNASASSAFTIYQTFTTEADSWYEVTFAYAARSSTDEAFVLSIFDGSDFDLEDLIFEVVIDDSEVNIWSVFSTTFVALSDTSTIVFSSLTTGTVGNLLDDVSVVDMPEPGALAIFALGIFGLLAVRKAKKS